MIPRKPHKKRRTYLWNVPRSAQVSGISAKIVVPGAEAVAVVEARNTPLN